jgi:hypothetical protein
LAGGFGSGGEAGEAKIRDFIHIVPASKRKMSFRHAISGFRNFAA